MGELQRFAKTPIGWKIPRALFALLFPDDCRLCGFPLTEISRVPVCPDCLRNPTPLTADYFCVTCRTPFVTRHPLDEDGRCLMCRLGLNGFDAVYTYGSYEGRLRELIHLFKYQRIEPLAKPLGEMTMAAYPREERFDAVVPMPMHWLRKWQRGFNQAELLAKTVARRTGLPVLPAVRRARQTAPQASLSNSGRRRNVAGAFTVRNAGSVRGCRLLLVDDVLTTGATASACATSLKRAGAAYVAVLALARTDRRYFAEPSGLAETRPPSPIGATRCA